MSTWNPKANDIFLQAAEAPSAEARGSLLADACGDDHELRAHVEALLEAGDGAGSFLDCPAPELEAAATEAPGSVIGPYKLLEQIGEGGMGVVFMAEQTEPIQRKVALKIIKPGMDTRQVIARFEAERQVLALMDHPNIAKVLDADSTETGRPYFVMELVRGVPITEFCDEGNLSTRERLKLLAQVCRAVQHAHQKGIIHRDIKPGNVLVTMHDDHPVPKVIDFGVAKATNQQLTERTLFTNFAQMIGTPLYMSPEQAQMNEIDVDTRSDVYSLGVLLYELLTGSTPFDSDALKEASYDEMRRIIREDEPPKPSARVSTLAAEALSTVSEKRRHDPRRLSQSLRGELDWIVLRAMEKDRTRRYESASDLAADIERYLNDEPILARSPSLGYRFRKFARRKRAALTMTSVVALAVLLVVGSLGWMVRDRDARQQEAFRQQTERQARVAGQVELILDDVDRLVEQHKWPAALATAKRAEALIAGGEAEEETETHVRQITSDLAMVQRLDEIRLLNSVYKQKNFDYEGTDQAYAAAFREFGIDVGQLSEAEAGTKCRARARVVVPLVEGLDHWSRMRRKIDESDRGGWRRLVVIAALVDADPFRNRLRDLWVEEPTDAIKKELAELAQSERLAGQPAATFDFLAAILKGASMPAEAESMLRQAQQAYPADFWINFRLARTINERNPGDAEAIRFYSAALALRPGNTAVLHNLGNVFSDGGQHDEAIAYYRKAIEFKAEFSYPYSGLGNVFMEQGKLDEAIDCYQTAIKIDPEMAKAHYNLGNAYYGLGKLDEAINCFRQAIKINPKYAIAHSSLGNVFADQGKLDEAMACYRKAIEVQPKDAVAHHNLGISLAKQGKLDEAITCFRQTIKINPKDADAYLVLGNIFMHQGKLDEAIEYYRRAISLDPEMADAHSNLGNIFLQQGKLDEAVACHREAIRVNPKFAIAHYNLGLGLAEQGKPDEAIKCYRRAIALDPKDVLLLRDLGLALEKQGKLDEAIACYREAIDINPKFMLAHYNLGVELAKRGKLDEAITCYETAIELNPKAADSHCNLGIILFRQGKMDEAITCYREAIKIRPKYLGAHYNLGMAYLEQGRFDEAIDHWRIAIDINPTYTDAHNGIAVALHRQGRPGAAIESYRKTLDLKPKYFLVHRNLGQVYRDLGKLDEAIACYRKALEFGPAYAPAHEDLIYAFKDRGKLDEAITFYREFLKRKPNYALAHHNLIEAFKEQGKLDQALTLYREAISRDPKYETAYKYLAKLLSDQGKLEEALVVLQAGAGANPKSASFPRRLGDIYRQQKKYDRALSSYDSALKLSPNYRTAYYHRGKVYCDQKKYELALADFSQGLNAKRPSIAGLVHVALFRLNCPDAQFRDTAEALRLAQQAVDLKPGNLTYNLTPADQAAWFALGQAQFRAGDYAAAIEALHESAELKYDRQAQSGFVLAMAHWKSGDQALARKLYQQAAKWMQDHQPPGAMFPQSQFRDEAAALMQPEKQILNPKS